MKSSFEGKVAIVTGGASGIGAAIAMHLARQGAKVVVADRDQELLHDVVADIKLRNGQAQAFEVDVSDPVAVEAMVKFSETTYGGLQLAVNNAGIGGPSAPTAHYAVDDWRSVMSVNLDGVFYCLKSELQAIERSGRGGAIVNMASILGTVGFSGSPAYVAAKHGVVG